jgi:hypothetical protein
MGIETFLSLLAEALFEVGTDNVGRVFLLRFLTFLESIDVIVEGVKQSLFLLFFLLELSFFELVGFQLVGREAAVLDGYFDTLHVSMLGRRGTFGPLYSYSCSSDRRFYHQ